MLRPQRGECRQPLNLHLLITDLVATQERRLRAAIAAAPGGVTEFERAIRALSVTLGGMAPTSVTITTDAAAGQASHWANTVTIELATRKSSSDVKN